MARATDERDAEITALRQQVADLTAAIAVLARSAPAHECTPECSAIAAAARHKPVHECTPECRYLYHPGDQ